jgi:membrane protein YqaA with SNARE-associated domain
VNDERSEPLPSDEELHAYVRRSAIKAGLILFALLVMLGGAGVFFEAELFAVTHWTYETVGLAGLALILFSADALTAPIPPDFVLIVVANSELRASWPWLVPALGMLSAVAGGFGWLLGVRLGRAPLARRLLGRFRQNQALVTRYGRWAVAFGALTPIPFSLTCWTAGMFHMRFAHFFPMTLLRVPRMVGYYIAIAYAEQVVRMLF